MSYSLRVFAAVYGHSFAQDGSAATVRLFYGRTPPAGAGSQLLHIPALYHEEKLKSRPSEFTRHRYASEDFFLLHGVDESTGRPDWLGEIFLWLSSSYERNIVVRDGIGRIPYSETVFARNGLSPRKPHASLLMAWMEGALIGSGTEPKTLPRAPSPVQEVQHLILCSHDIDFYFVNRSATLMRLIKNLAIAIRPYRSSSYFIDNLKMCAQLFAGKRIGDYLPALVDAAHKSEFRSTFFVVPRRGDRRDPDYRLDQLAPQLLNAAKDGFSVGVHGSYRSIVEDRSLAAEAGELSKWTGQKPMGGRQHWLRFSKHEDLFAEIVAAGFLADSTLGFADMVGFRNGASFAFPPYDFQRERPHDFLEIPLVVMDGNLESASRELHISPQLLAEEVLAESRKVGWGGIAALWHNPLESLSVPAEINHVFWSCVDKQKEFREKWMSLDEFVKVAIPRYQQAGLLQGVQLNT